MKKILIIIIGVFVFIYGYLFFGRCGVLPKNTNYEVILGSKLYKLTKNGLVEMGLIGFGTWDTQKYLGNIILNKSQKNIYFFDVDYGTEADHKLMGIYKTGLDDFTAKPALVLETNDPALILSLSPDENFLLFVLQEQSQPYVVFLLELKTGKKQKLFNDYNLDCDAIWINDHQFVYGSTKINEANKKNILYLYDINSKAKIDLHMDGYCPGALSPDGKELILASEEKTILYNVYDSNIKIIANRRMPIGGAIWLSDGEGFLYSDMTFEEFLDAFIFVDAHYGLYYYSLKKKKSVRLIKYYNLASERGFIVPPGLNINIPGTDSYRKMLAENPSRHLIKICKLW